MIEIHDLARPLLRHFRRRRMQRFAEEFNITRDTTVLDVGGNTFNWQFVDPRPRLTFLNLGVEHFGGGPDQDALVIGDGCELPFGSKSFDVVFCNSVIEHLGTHQRQKQMAGEIARVGRAYFVQTPNYWYPIEPHYLAPGVQFLPMKWRGRFTRAFTPWGWTQRPSAELAEAFAAEISLLRRDEVRALFPGATVKAERALGLAKSWIAQFGTSSATVRTY